MNRRRLWRIAKMLLGLTLLGACGAGAVLFLLRPVPVRVGTVVRRDLAPAIQGVGTVEARAVVQIGAKITGRLTAVLVDQGDTVRAGQVVARLEDAELAAQTAQAEASLRRAALATAAQEAALRKAQAALGTTEAQVNRVRATEALSRVNAQRWRQLFAEGGVSRVEMDARTTEADVATSEIANAEAQRQTAREEVAVLRAGLETSRQDVRVAEATLAAVRIRQADAVVRSALAGVVISRELEPGATVSPGTPILKIADPAGAWVTVHVDERETGGIRIGDAAEIALRSLPGRTVPGRVVRIRRESDRVTEQLAVDVAFQERPVRLTLGEQAEATIRPEGVQEVTAVPLSALIRTPDGPAAFVVTDGRLRLRPIRIGLVDPEGWAEVRDGLRPDERVVLAPGRLADPKNDGKRVRVENEQPTTDKAQ
ncbi:MAG: efflux RND transporter periplasmic adaptor subunit [Candidatus Methylomirabilota bacterium]